MASRFVPVSSWEELEKLYDAGLLYFNYSLSIPRGPQWELENRLIDNIRGWWSSDLKDSALAMREDWGYLVEED